MFPPTVTLNPDASRIRPVNSVVVDFPFVPVIATMRPRSHRDASSSSPMTGTPAFRAFATTGCSGGTPGLITIRSASANVSARCPPSSSATPSWRSGSASDASVRVSDTVTRAPRFASSSAAAMPLLAAPATVTRLPFTSGSRATSHEPRATTSPQFQRRQTEQREDDSDNHEPADDLRLAPPALLEVVMNRSHLEDTLTGHLERRHLDDDRQTFHQKHAADDEEQQFLFDQNRDRRERGTKRQRSDVAHEDLRRVRVVPEEAERRADERTTEHGELGDWRQVNHIEIVGKNAVADDIGHCRVRRCRDRHRADRETVEAVGQIHGVGPPDEEEDRERHVLPSQIQNQPLEEREDEPRVVQPAPFQPDQDEADDGAGEHLIRDLVTRQQAVVRLADDLQIVVGEPNRSIS